MTFRFELSKSAGILIRNTQSAGSTKVLKSKGGGFRKKSRLFDGKEQCFIVA
jgi:hypothetical protein